MLSLFERLRLLVRGLTANRRAPSLERLRAETDPERFLWTVLPHAARTFAASIAMLPPPEAKTAAIAYAYCRMLDTLEDLTPEGRDRIAALRSFVARFDEGGFDPVVGSSLVPRTETDRVNVLLVRRHGLIDELFRSLPPHDQSAIADLVRSMGSGMILAAERFADQGGVLQDESQVLDYCRAVIGMPVLFVFGLMEGRPPVGAARDDALAVGEMIQLANVTRDIEADLDRGVGYHESLGGLLRGARAESMVRETIRSVRRRYTAAALARAPAYRRLYEGSSRTGEGAVRMAALLMLRFTDLHYRNALTKAGEPAWPGPSSRFGVVIGAIPALFSAAWTLGRIRRIEARFLGAATRLAG